MCEQLQGNVKRDNPNAEWDMQVFQNYLKWYGSIDGATKDLIRWRSACKPFNNNTHINKYLTTTKAD